MWGYGDIHVVARDRLLECVQHSWTFGQRLEIIHYIIMIIQLYLD